MRTATASRLKAGAHLATALALGGLALGGLSACGNGAPTDGDAGDNGDTGNCVVDDSTGPATAIPLVAGMAPTGTLQICPRGDVDWYSIVVPAGQSLLDVAASFPMSVTRVSLSVQLYMPDGKTPAPSGNLLGKPSAKLSSTLLAPEPGTYFLSVRDAMDAVADNNNTYVITATPAADPDTHEPNDTAATAKPSDGKPGWFAYQGDKDYYTITVPPGQALVQFGLSNFGPLHYQLSAAAGGATVAVDDLAPAPQSRMILRSVPAPGAYVLALSTVAAPDRGAMSSYLVSLGALPELDPNDQGARNDSAATATCLSSGCSSTFSGSPLTFPSNGGQVGSLGDRDFFRFDVAAGAPAIVVAKASIATSGIDFALDLLTPHDASKCTSDKECVAINQPCSSDNDCELSHACLMPDNYAFCPPGQACRLCVGASACVPGSGGAKVCAAPQYLVHSTGGKAQTLRTAQPLFTPGPYYLVVHDFGDNQFDYGKSYTLDVSVVPEPDAGDQSPDPARRNNFYNPYPMQSDKLDPNIKRATDVSAQIAAGMPISGFISYQTDEDWYSFPHPCPGMDCGLQFEWVQPGPSPVQMLFLLRRGGDLQIHESWVYNGTTPTINLTGPATDVFGDGDCHECSFAAKDDGANNASFRYYMQVRSLGSTAWDQSHPYSFRLKSVTPGCPPSCSEAPGGKCYCFCKSLNMCPPSM